MREIKFRVWDTKGLVLSSWEELLEYDNEEMLPLRKEIYEGDIVVWEHDEDQTKNCVGFDSGAFWIIGIGDLLIEHLEGIKVVGHIYATNDGEETE